MSSLAVTDKVVAYSTAAAMHVVDAITGQSVADTPLGIALPAERSPDVVVVRGDRIVLSAETAAAGFDAGTGALVWRHRIRGSDARTLAAMTRDTETAIRDATIQAKGPDYDEDGVKPLKMPAMRPGSEDFDAIRAQVDLVTGYYDQAKDAYQYARAALSVPSSLRSASGRADLVLELSATMNAALTAYFQSIRLEQVSTTIDRRKIALRMASRAHMFSVQGDHVIRPVRLQLAEGIFIAKVSDGAWAEVPVAPFEATVPRDLFMDTQLAVLSPDQKYLLTKGISLHPESWERDERSEAVTTVFRSLFGFPVERIVFKPASEYATASIARPPMP